MLLNGQYFKMDDLIPDNKHSLINTKKTMQTGNIVNGDLAGGNINKSIYMPESSVSAELGRLTEKFKKELENNIQFNEVIEKLEHYITPIANDEIIGLEAKLKEGKRSTHLPFASSTKERYVKKLAKHQFYEAAQEIHSYLLAEVYTRYYNQIHPQITNGAQESEINDLIQSKIINPILGLFNENILHIYADDINGMLYYLTGNCHIKWV